MLGGGAGGEGAEGQVLDDVFGLLARQHSFEHSLLFLSKSGDLRIEGLFAEDGLEDFLDRGFALVPGKLALRVSDLPDKSFALLVLSPLDLSFLPFDLSLQF